MKSRYNRKQSGVIFAFSLLVASRLFAAETTCDGPSKLIDITVKRAAMSPPTYVYAIKNHYQYPIVDLALGISDHREMRIMPDNIPSAIESPRGWEGQQVFFEESEYMQIFWWLKDARFAIAPGTSLTGFKLVMPHPVKREKPLYLSDGALAIPIDIRKMPAKVRFKDGACAWADVKVE